MHSWDNNDSWLCHRVPLRSPKTAPSVTMGTDSKGCHPCSACNLLCNTDKIDLTYILFSFLIYKHENNKRIQNRINVRIKRYLRLISRHIVWAQTRLTTFFEILLLGFHSDIARISGTILFCQRENILGAAWSWSNSWWQQKQQNSLTLMVLTSIGPLVVTKRVILSLIYSLLGTQCSLDEVIQNLAAAKSVKVKRTQCLLYMMPNTAKKLVPLLLETMNFSPQPVRPKAM